jgi:hypothetical protein
MTTFDDPKPPPDTRKPQLIYPRPSLRDRIDRQRGRLTRSEWIERAVMAHLRAEKPPRRFSRPMPLDIREDRTPAQRAADGDT